MQRGSGSIHPGRAAGSRACCRTEIEGRCRAELARGQRGGSHLGFETEGERTGVDPGGCGSCPENVNVEVQQLEKQEAAANEIESRKNAQSAGNRAERNVLDRTAITAQQDMGPNKAIRGIQMVLFAQRILLSDMHRQFPEHSAQLSSLRRDLHEIRCRSDGRSWRRSRAVSTNSEPQQQASFARCHDLEV